MSIHDLIEFAQQNYASLEGVPNARPRDPNINYEPFPDNRIANQNVQGERPPIPEWLPEEDDPSVVAIDSDDVLTTEGGLSPDGLLPPGTESGTANNRQVTIDALAYYLPYHFYSTRWGIYLKTSGILYVASLLDDGLFPIGDDDLLELARRLLFEHEFFHFVAETACARAETVAKMRLYDPYYPHPFAAPHEEALANAHAIRNALVGQPATLKKRVSAWMDAQGPGYRDYGRWLGRNRFDEGCRLSAFYMTQPIRGGAAPVAPPAEFLFAPPTRKSVPTRLVINTRVGMLKRFPKFFGMRVVVHTNEHPPPHFHVERPPGTPVTRYRWPELTPYPEDPPLSNSEEKELRKYVKRYGEGIDKKVRSVFPSNQTPTRPLRTN